MASRRVQPTKTKLIVDDMASDSEDGGLDFFASQRSSGSDDHEFEIAIAEKLAAKKKDKQQKFLKAACKLLNDDLSSTADEVKSTIDKIESIFADFLLQYATCEDRIRNLLGQILTEQQKLLTLADERIVANVEAGKKVEAGHISGLSKAKAACNVFQEVINKIVPLIP